MARRKRQQKTTFSGSVQPKATFQGGLRGMIPKAKGSRTPLSPSEPRPVVTEKPKAKAQAALASKKDLPRLPDETDEAYAKRQADHVANRQKLTKNMLAKSGSQYNDDFSRKEKKEIRKARSAFQSLGERADKLKAKSSSADLSEEEKAAIAKRLESVKTEKKAANEQLVDVRDARRQEATKQYAKELRERQGKDATLFTSKERLRRLKKARGRSKKGSKKGTVTIT
jgi:hypothetical protein